MKSNSAADRSPPSKPSQTLSPWRGIKVGAFVVLVVAISCIAYLYRDQWTLDNLVQHEMTFRAFHQEHPVLVYAVVFGVYVAVTALSLPLAVPMSLLIGWYFGFWRGVVIVSFSSTLGATLAFLITRYLLREAFQAKFGARLQTFDEALAREGAFYLFTLRLIPAVPFFVINAVMGLTRIRLWTFWWVSQLGMLAGTCVYVYAGSTIPSLQELTAPTRPPILTWDRIAAFAALGLFPLLVKKVMNRWRKPGASGARTTSRDA